MKTFTCQHPTCLDGEGTYNRDTIVIHIPSPKHCLKRSIIQTHFSAGYTTIVVSPRHQGETTFQSTTSIPEQNNSKTFCPEHLFGWEKQSCSNRQSSGNNQYTKKTIKGRRFLFESQSKDSEISLKSSSKELKQQKARFPKYQPKDKICLPSTHHPFNRILVEDNTIPIFESKQVSSQQIQDQYEESYDAGTVKKTNDSFDSDKESATWQEQLAQKHGNLVKILQGSYSCKSQPVLLKDLKAPVASKLQRIRNRIAALEGKVRKLKRENKLIKQNPRKSLCSQEEEENY